MHPYNICTTNTEEFEVILDKQYTQAEHCHNMYHTKISTGTSDSQNKTL